MINTTEQSREPISVVQADLILTAVAALLLGAAVYLLGRDSADSLVLGPDCQLSVAGVSCIQQGR